MREGIHPDYPPATVSCACGNTFVTRSTRGDFQVDVCAACHPFYTGTQKLIDAAGRVDRFRKRYDAASLDAVIRLEVEKRHTQTQVEKLRADKNAASKSISKAPPDQRASLIEANKKLGVELEGLEKKLVEQEKELEGLLIQIPNPPHESAADGGRDEGTVVSTHGQKPAFDTRRV